MSTGLEETLGAIIAAFSLNEAAGAIGGTLASTRSLQEKFLEEAGKRTIFEAPPRENEMDNPPFLSPVFRALFGIYKDGLPRRSYVCLAPPSTGKTAAAKHLMQCLPKFPNAPNSDKSLLESSWGMARRPSILKFPYSCTVITGRF